MVQIYIYIGVSVYWPQSVLCVCVCDIKLEYSKKPHYGSDLGKRDALLHKTYIKVLLVLRYQGLTFIDLYYH